MIPDENSCNSSMLNNPISDVASRETHLPQSSRYFKSGVGWASERTQRELCKLIPQLSFAHNKGDLGRVCIVGGSRVCTGPPLLIGLAAVKCGADIVTIITTPSASEVIKCYSPLLTVVPFLPEEDAESSTEPFVERVWPFLRYSQALCVGPGLETNKCTLKAVANLLLKARWSGIPIVIDTDILWLLGKNLDLVSQMLPNSPVLLTPNEKEFRELYSEAHTRGIMSWHCTSESEEVEEGEEEEPGSRPEGVPIQRPRRRRGSKNLPCPEPFTITDDCPVFQEFQVSKYKKLEAVWETAQLSRALGSNVYIIRKGSVDITTSGFRAILFAGVTVPMRCAGQGHVLAGLSLMFAAWMHISKDHHNPLVAACGASFLTRLAALDAFQKHKRAMTAYDILSYIPGVLYQVSKAYVAADVDST